jgi:hypothetical protein
MRVQPRLRTSHILIASAVLAAGTCLAGSSPPRGTQGQHLYTGWAETTEVVPPLPTCTVNEAVLHDQFRLVYENEMLWTRMVTVGVIHDITGHDVWIDRFKENYEAFEQVLVPIYGTATEKFGALLEENMDLTVEVLHEIQAGMDVRTVLPQWYDNADQIAAYLSGLNPEFWPQEEMRAYWKVYVDDILKGALAFHAEDWKNDVILLNVFHGDCIAMADYMTAGIAKQCAASP